MTETPVYSISSSAASLRGLRLVLFIAELNQLKVWTTDVGNAYLEAETQEKVYIVGGPEFRDRGDHVMIIRKALYGLRSSGLMWWDRCSEILTSMGFTGSMAEDDIWMKKEGNHYAYVVRYVDDLAIALVDPEAMIQMSTSKHGLKLKGTGPIGYHLGCDFFRDKQDTLCMAPKKYVT